MDIELMLSHRFLFSSLLRCGLLLGLAAQGATALKALPSNDSPEDAPPLPRQKQHHGHPGKEAQKRKSATLFLKKASLKSHAPHRLIESAAPVLITYGSHHGGKIGIITQIRRDYPQIQLRKLQQDGTFSPCKDD